MSDPVLVPQQQAPWVAPGTGKPGLAFYNYQVRLTAKINGVQSGAKGITAPTGGAVVDTEARAAITALITAIGNV